MVSMHNLTNNQIKTLRAASAARGMTVIDYLHRILHLRSFDCANVNTVIVNQHYYNGPAIAAHCTMLEAITLEEYLLEFSNIIRGK